MTNIMFRLAWRIGLIDRSVYHFIDLLTGVAVVELGENAGLLQLGAVPREDFPENWFEIKERRRACVTLFPREVSPTSRLDAARRRG